MLWNKDSCQSLKRQRLGENKQPFAHQNGIASSGTFWPRPVASILFLVTHSSFRRHSTAQHSTGSPTMQLCGLACATNTSQQCFMIAWPVWKTDYIFNLRLRQGSRKLVPNACMKITPPGMQGKELNDRPSPVKWQNGQAGKSQGVCLGDTIPVCKQKCAWACFQVLSRSFHSNRQKDFHASLQVNSLEQITFN